MEDDDFSFEEYEGTPPELRDDANEGRGALIPPFSKKKYWNEYEDFTKWKKEKHTKSSSKHVLLAYFKYLLEVKKYKPSTLGGVRSKLKATLRLKENLDIENYITLKAFLKRHNKGYHPKKSKVLTKEQLERFIKNADDERWFWMLR